VQNGRNAYRFLKQAYGFATTNFAAFEPVIVRGVILANEETQDAVDQTQPFGFSPDPVPAFVSAQFYMSIALDTTQSFLTRTIAIQKALIRLQGAENTLLF
jgi:hypothetical protein